MNIIKTLSILLFGTTTLGIASPAQAWIYRYPFPWTEPKSEPPELPEYMSDRILEDISQSSGLSISDLQIVDTESVVWSNGCMGFRGPLICTMALVDGWITTVQSSQQRWSYHNSGLAQHYQWNVNPETQNWVYSMTDFTYSPFNPILWDFEDQKHPFFNPSSVTALRYTTLNDTFTIDVTPEMDIFNPEAFSKRKDSIFGFDIEPVFNPDNYRWSVSYQVEVLEKPPKTVPEPNAVGTLAFLGLWGLKAIASRKG